MKVGLTADDALLNRGYIRWGGTLHELVQNLLPPFERPKLESMVIYAENIPGYIFCFVVLFLFTKNQQNPK